MSERNPESIRRAIEVEYWVIDNEGRLVEPGALVNVSPEVEQEFVKPLLEIKTTPCESTAELRTELIDRIATVLRAADNLDKRLVPLATTVDTDHIQELPSERTRIQNEAVGENFKYVRHCAGTHIHIEQQEGHEIDQVNTLTALDPAFALVNSSPYFQGQLIANGARPELYRRRAYDTLPDHGQLWPYVDDLNEWNQRLEQRYDEFVTAAMDAGVDRQAIESSFTPESAVWTPVRLREMFGTIEWRSSDTALPSQILRLADDVVGIVAGLKDTNVHIGGDVGGVSGDDIVLPAFNELCEYVSAAIQDGVASDRVRSYLSRMGFNVQAYDPVSQHIDKEESVTPEAARQIRLKYADRLERDVFDRN